MNSDNNMLRDTAFKEIENICANASDWQDALEKIATDYCYLDSKTIINLIDYYFFKKDTK